MQNPKNPLGRVKPGLAVVTMLVIMLVTMVTLAGGQSGQEIEKPYLPIFPGQRLGVMAPGLIRISSYTNFFLTLGDRIQMTPRQRRRIEKLAFAFHRRIIQLVADKRLAEAELDRLLTQQEISLKDIKMKLREVESMYTEMRYQQIATAIKVINQLNPQQQVKIILAVREQRSSDAVGLEHPFEPDS